MRLKSAELSEVRGGTGRRRDQMPSSQWERFVASPEGQYRSHLINEAGIIGAEHKQWLAAAAKHSGKSIKEMKVEMNRWIQDRGLRR